MIIDVGCLLVKIVGFIKPITEFFCHMFKTINDFTPSSRFLTDVATFEGVIIAIIIPLSFEMVSRISERYESEIIVRKFYSEKFISSFPVILIINIIMVISLIFLDDPLHKSILWKIIFWVTFILFLVVVLILMKFLNLLRRYITDTKFILNRLFDDAEKLFKE